MSHAKFKQDMEASIGHYWGGLKELVEQYFSRPRSVEQELFWIKVTCYKEIKAIPKILTSLKDQYPGIDREVERRLYEGIAYELADEVKHYRLLADIMDGLTGGRIRPDECSASPEQTKLEELRKTLKADIDLAPHLNVAHETAFASIMMKVSGGALEKKVGRAYKHIYADEIKHYRLAWTELRNANLEPAQIERIKRSHKTVGRQYLVMRNELFGHPLSQERLREIDEGKVQSYQLR